MGRPSIPIAEHKMRGTYRPNDRHAARADAAPPNGLPIKPSGFGPVEAALWDQIVPDLMRRNLVGAKDTAGLVCLCEMWGLYRASYELARTAPTNKEVRCAVTAYYMAFGQLCKKFGLTSADLAALKVPQEGTTKKTVQTRVRA